MPELLRNNLRDAREAMGWTQAELADAIGVSRKTVNTVENGVFIPSVVVALKLAHGACMYPYNKRYVFTSLSARS